MFPFANYLIKFTKFVKSNIFIWILYFFHISYLNDNASNIYAANLRPNLFQNVKHPKIFLIFVPK